MPEQSGYAYRSHAILRELQSRGIELNIMTSPKQGVLDGPVSNIDGLSYRRVMPQASVSYTGIAGQLRTIRQTRRGIQEALQSGRVDVVHAHSPCLNGLAALGHGIPLVYEMRSSWEDAAVSVGTTTEDSLRYRISKALESYVVRRADAVTVICEGLKQELMRRGIAEQKITIAANALPAEMFELPTAAEVQTVRARYVSADAKLIGFFGSFFEWEGVDDLVRVMPAVVAAIPEARLLLAGGGRQERELRELTARYHLDDQVIFAGRVSHHDVKALYGAVDVMAFPRVRHRLTDMVTPIKPLEAMAQNAVVVASDVGGHQELVRHDVTGVLYPAGDREALTRVLIDVLSNPRAYSEIRQQARDYVEQERRWSTVAENYLPVYDSVRRGQKNAR